MPGGLASPWGGLGPGQAGKGWGPRDQLQGFGPQALAAQALQRGRGRWQSGGCVVFLPGEEPGSGSHCPHTMGPAGTCQGRDPRLVGPPPDLSPAPDPRHNLDPDPPLTLARPVEGCPRLRGCDGAVVEQVPGRFGWAVGVVRPTRVGSGGHQADSGVGSGGRHALRGANR